MNSKLRLRTGTALLLMTAPLPAWAHMQPDAPAQTAEAAADEQTGDQSNSGDIIVTAERRAQRLIDVPLSITAVTGDDLERLNATQLRDYANTIPALTINPMGGAGQNQVTLRGVTSGADVAATVGIYVDEVPYGGSTVFSINTGLALDAGLFDLDRIEVLRGPQGTLYGASSMGGVLKYVTRRPNANRFEVAGRAGLSFTEDGGTGFNLAAGINVPLAEDRVALRASGFFTRDGGFVDDLGRGEENVGRADIYGGRLDLWFQPTDELSIRLTGYAQDIHRDGTAQVDYTLAGQPVDGDLDQRRVLQEPFDQEFQVVSGTINYDFGSAVLTSITSYQVNDVFFRLDASSLYPLLLNPVLVGLFGLPPLVTSAVDGGVNTEKFTQEVRLASSGGETIDWIVGGFYTSEDSVSVVNLVGSTTGGAPYPLDLLTSNLPSTYEELAAFGNITVHVTDRLDVTGGLRYASNTQSYTQNATGILVPPAPSQSSEEDVITYLANARYRFSNYATAYVRFATGYRPGGPNVVTVDPATGLPLGPATFESDTLASYEAGFKGETVDRRFGIDAAVYHIDWNDMQVSRNIGGFNSYVNSQGATIDGAELNSTARPSPGVTFTGALAYQDAKLTEAAPDLGGSAGERLPNVPRFSATFNADYRLSEEGIAPTLGATLRYVSDRELNFDADVARPQFDLGDYATLDLRAGATFGPVNAQIFVRNLFDDRGAYSANTQFAAAGAPARVSVLQPRTIGVSLNTRF